MKLVPGPLPPIPTGAGTMDRIPLPLPFGTDFLWRYPMGFGPLQLPQTPPSPLMDYKSQLPAALASDPRVWSRDDVITFLGWAEREFDLQPFEFDNFQMNGKAMCLLTRADLSERAPGSGDILHNVLQLLVREANNLQRCLPSSPITPTTRQPYPLSPHAHPSTPNWNLLTHGNAESFPNSHAATIAAHLMAQSNSATLSPAPSVEGSPQHAENQQNGFGQTMMFSSNGSNGSNPSDSDEDSFGDGKNAGSGSSPPNTPSAYALAPLLPYGSMPPKSPKEAASSPGPYKREFFSSSNESNEPNTNGRLLWDFLQQLLNDPNQRYTSYIAWKNHESGVFKIVDPAGLAKLWGIQKNHLSMNYDKMSRALRYYYRVNILRKVQGERHCYQFLRNPNELKGIKNMSLLRQQQMSPTRTTTAPQQQQQMMNAVSVKPEPMDEQTAPAPVVKTEEIQEGPTDLSIRHVDIVCSPDTQSLREPPAHYYNNVSEEQ